MSTASWARTFRTLITIIVAVVVLPTLCLAATFSADLVQKAGGQTMNGKLYMKGTKIRQDISMGQMKMSTIIRPDKKVVWIVQSAQKTYMETPLPKESKSSATMDLDSVVQLMGGKAAVTQKVLGKETVNGYSCDKVQITPKKVQPGMPAQPITLWVSKKLGIPLRVKTADHNGMQMDFKNIREGNVPDSVFDIPKGFKKQAMPSMGGRGRGQRMGGGAPRGPMPH